MKERRADRKRHDTLKRSLVMKHKNIKRRELKTGVHKE